MNNNKYTPFIVFAIFVTGLLAGRYLFRSEGSDFSFSFFNGRVSKIQSVVNLVDKKYVDEVNIDYISEKIIPQILSLLDPHSTYVPTNKRTESEQHLVGHFCGVGIEYAVFNDTAIVTNVVYGGPAQTAGVIPGDKLISVNDSLYAGLSAVKNLISNNLKGEKGTTVQIGVLRSTVDSLLYFDVTRNDIPLYSVHGGYMADSATAYVAISSFAANTYDELMVKIDSLKLLGMKNLVIDLRSNSGGYIRTAVKIANEFLKDGEKIVYTQNHNGILNEYNADGSGTMQDINLVIVVDSYSASASEILSGAFQDNDRAAVVGRRTYGKGLVQEPVELSDGSVIRITIARYYTPTGRCIQKPYDDYKNDMKNRAKNGELDSADAITFADSLKFTTPSGKTVYGGGGIMPDVFVPINPDNVSGVVYNIESENITSRFAAAQFNRFYNDTITCETMLDGIFAQPDLLTKFASYAQYCGITLTVKDFQPYSDKIENSIRAYIYSMWNRECDMYITKNVYDTDISAALNYFKPDTLQIQ